MALLRVGTAGWQIPSAVASAFPGEGTHLERYARIFSCVEINTTFYRSHLAATYARWAASVPPDFRFAVKLARAITHERRLVDCAGPVRSFVDEISGLGNRRGPVLVQLPPSLAFDELTAGGFFSMFRSCDAGEVACEPRHRSWFTSRADLLLRSFKIARVAADPAVVPEAATPGGWLGLLYHRLHGSPEMYYSEYGDTGVAPLADLETGGSEAWCLFDNTARGSATGDALRLIEMRAGRVERAVR